MFTTQIPLAGTSFSFPFTGKSSPKMPISCRTPTSHAPLPFPSSFTVFESRKPSSFYEILRVKQTASSMEIKTAYRTLAKLYHPDALQKSESDSSDFIEIHNAYSTLSDPASRAVYDLSLSDDHHRRMNPCVYSTGNGMPSFYSTRRWETDQCW